MRKLPLPPARALRALNPFAGDAPVDLRIVGRTLLHASLVGIIAGLLGAAFFSGLEVAQHLILERLAGLGVLRAHGEAVGPSEAVATLRPWLLAILPALGGLASGVLTWWLAPEASGGGGDAAIEAYHHGGLVRARVVPVKGIAAILALSTGGSGGREGPTMQIGAGIGAAVARLLPASRAERRILLVAGIAAGISAVFRTPLGAALLATEMLYRDDFEAEALIPSIFASVVSYSVVITLYGETTVFGGMPRFPFRPSQLPLYALLAIAVALAGAAFVRLLRGVQRAAKGIPGPTWTRPTLGGLLMGLTGTALLLWMRARHGPGAAGFGVFGGGYGVLQTAMTGATWLTPGWTAVGVLLLVALAKMVASALTVGSGAAAGDFAPSLVIGGLLGAAFGHAARAALGDPGIDPAAFTLVGMGTFYGGLAHAPLSALVLVAELAGSYDLLVPMMLAIGIAYVGLRRTTLYPAQPPGRTASPVHREAPDGDLLGELVERKVPELMVPPEVAPVDERAPLSDVAEEARSAMRQRVLVVQGAGGWRGLLELAAVADVPPAERGWLRARDAAVPFTAVDAGASWAEVAVALDTRGVSQVPVVRDGAVIGWIGDLELRRALVEASRPVGG